ncbi:LytTR family DNA-binding domain-containing protein [Variovorax sp. J31P207]|uniref:LytR/AlgR family response regulator transcription factor n=1 Tax=Variovorax sp. J31P207 TaxID=3053510 RepID=UPI00257636CD|nr:LytTR family DNA-binding domain-containing protein [Variovorax sp. J31P207]MDM0066560.1 LytTR family DNA-binding domain-containing protein [Variovorax sp. J31P207]
MSAMRRHTALVAEDEDVLREELQAHLRDLWPDLHIEASAGNGLEALLALDRHVPDVVFLDIEMPGLNGIDIARQIQGRSHVVFVTAYDAYAVAAFEQGAVDYVLKPYDLPRLSQTIRRVKERLGSAPPSLDMLLRELAAARPVRDHLRWINASQGQDVRIITVDEICYFRAESKYTLVITADGESLIRRSLKELLEQLDPSQFWLVHRSTIVNANAIAGVSRDFRGHVHLKLKQRSETLAVSEAHEHLFRSM